MEQKRDFTGVWIPKEVLLDKDLSSDEKILFADIACFENCFILNRTFADRYGCSERTIQNRLKKLKDKGFIVEKSFDGRERTLQVLHVFSYQTRKGLRGRGEESFTPEVKNLSPIDNNIDNIEKRGANSFFSENPEIRGLLEEGSLTLGGEYSSDGRSPLIRRAEKRALEKALGLRKTPELVRFIYKAGWDFRKAFKEAKGDEYEGDVILDQIAKTLVEWHKRGRTTEDIRRLLEAFFRSKKAKENTVTPTSCFSEHTYQSFAQGTLK